MIIAFFAAAALVTLGAADMEVKRFQRDAAQDIARRLDGEAKQVSVSVRSNGLLGTPLGDLSSATVTASGFQAGGMPLFTEPQHSKRGRIGELRLRLREFEVRGLQVASLEAAMPDCRFDFAYATRNRAIRLTRSGTGPGTVRLRFADLERYLVAKFKEIKSIQLSSTRGALRAEGVGEFLLVRTKFTVIANVVGSGPHLTLADARVFFDDRLVDDATAEGLLRTLNPILDLDRDLGLCGAFDLKDVRLMDDGIEADGLAHIPNEPEPVG